MTAISVSGLTKDYGDVLANDDVSFTVERGEVFGYLGPNGAGKSTTIRTLMGFQSPTSGTAEVLGADVREESEMVQRRARIGYVSSSPGFDETATGEEILGLHAAIKGDERRGELLELFDVPLERKIRGYSTGQRQKLGLVQAFMHDPELIVMDEPTAGLDPLMQRRFEEFVREEKADGKSLLVSSHVLSEVRRICDRVGIIRNGKIVTVEAVEDLVHRSGKTVRLLVADEVDEGDLALEGVHDPKIAPLETEEITQVQFTYTGEVNALVSLLEGFDLVELDVEEAPLDQVFMQFYGEADGGTAAEVTKTQESEQHA
jgi:ABC-2 type transport system ATP-binding protein